MAYTWILHMLTVLDRASNVLPQRKPEEFLVLLVAQI
jgi:hypothetical protein